MYYSNPRHRTPQPPEKKKKKNPGVFLPLITVILCTFILSYSSFINNSSEDLPVSSDSDTPSEPAVLPDSETSSDPAASSTPAVSLTPAASSTPAAPQDPVPSSGPVSTAELPSLREYCDSLFAGNTVDINGDTCLLESGNLLPVTDEDISSCFYSIEIPDTIFMRMKDNSYGEDCTVPLSELRYIRVLHYGFDGFIHIGELVVNKAVSEDMTDIFLELYEKKYPIEKMLLIDEFEADDEISMMANNTSCFNFRNISGSTALSNHAYGLAIDINPLYNPYIAQHKEKTVILPATAKKYADRTLDCEYYIDTEDECYIAFTSHGFTWGGDWVSKQDYQHFEKKLTN